MSVTSLNRLVTVCPDGDDGSTLAFTNAMTKVAPSGSMSSNFSKGVR
jgi:hypothetical protein